jgi:hypothetical protein
MTETTAADNNANMKNAKVFKVNSTMNAAVLPSDKTADGKSSSGSRNKENDDDDASDVTGGTFPVASLAVLKERSILKVARSAVGQFDPSAAVNPSANANMMGGTGTSTAAGTAPTATSNGTKATTATTATGTTTTAPKVFGSTPGFSGFSGFFYPSGTCLGSSASGGAGETKDSTESLTAESKTNKVDAKDTSLPKDESFVEIPSESPSETPVKESSTMDGKKKRKLLHSPTQQPEEGTDAKKIAVEAESDTQGIQEATAEDSTAKKEYQQRALYGAAALEGHLWSGRHGCHTWWKV